MRIGFDRLYLAEQPEDDNIKTLYWDKFVKKRARAEALSGGVTTVPTTRSTCKQIAKTANLNTVFSSVDLAGFLQTMPSGVECEKEVAWRLEFD
jgi:hypothetical protein